MPILALPVAFCWYSRLWYDTAFYNEILYDLDANETQILD